MSELMELQRRMARAVMHPLTKSETMPRRRHDGTLNQKEAEAFIKPNDRLTSFERLEIYNRQYWFRLYTSFEEDFPGLKAILGRQKFETLMRDYLTECPSESFTLRNLGSRLASWLNQHPSYIEPHTTLALDMVHIEWAHIEAFDSAADPLLDPDELATMNEHSHLRLQPYLRLLELSYPVDDLLIVVRSESGSSDASSNNASATRKTKHVRHVAALSPEQIFLAVHRLENSVYYKRLKHEDYLLLQSLISGATLGEAIDAALHGSTLSEEQQSKLLQEAFANWSMLGWFTQLERQHTV